MGCEAVENENEIPKDEKKYSEKDLEKLLKKFKMDYKSRKFPLGFMILLILGITLLIVYLYIMPVLEVVDKGRDAAEDMSNWEIMYDSDVLIQNQETFQLTMEDLTQGDDIAISFAVETNNAPADSDSGEVDYSFKFGGTVIQEGEDSTGEEILYKVEQDGNYLMSITNADKDYGVLPASQTSDTVYVSVLYNTGESSTPQPVEDLGMKGICLIPVLAFLILGGLGVGIWGYRFFVGKEGEGKEDTKEKKG
jgi:hypothetical protein